MNPYRLLARSRTALAQVLTGCSLRAAAASYAALRAGLSLSSSRSVSGSSMGGLPLPRFGASGLVIGFIVPVQKISCNFPK